MRDFLRRTAGRSPHYHDVQDYSKAIQSADEDLLSAPNAAGVGLYETLIRPVAQHLKKGMRVVVVPDGALHGLNFETLVVNDGKPHYWIDDVSVTVAPSLRILLDRSKAVRNSSKALVIGDGDYSAAQDKYPPLPESKKEVAGVSALFSRCQHRTDTRAGGARSLRPRAARLVFSHSFFRACGGE